MECAYCGLPILEASTQTPRCCRWCDDGYCRFCEVDRRFVTVGEIRDHLASEHGPQLRPELN